MNRLLNICLSHYFIVVTRHDNLAITENSNVIRINILLFFYNMTQYFKKRTNNYIYEYIHVEQDVFCLSKKGFKYYLVIFRKNKVPHVLLHILHISQKVPYIVYFSAKTA